MIKQVANKPWRLAVGLMSGTSVDGIDAALVELEGLGADPKVRLLAFRNMPYPPAVREKIFALFRPENATVDKVGYMNFLLGEYFAEAALAVIQEAGVDKSTVDFIASHGQTIWHAPQADCSDGYPIRCTVQIGEGAVIAERTAFPPSPTSGWPTWPPAARARPWCPLRSICSTAGRRRPSCSRTLAASAT